MLAIPYEASMERLGSLAANAEQHINYHTQSYWPYKLTNLDFDLNKLNFAHLICFYKCV